MDRFLITHSLLNSWLYLLRENPYETTESEENRLDDFLRVLKRIPTPTTPAMQNGIDFEDMVTAIMDGEPNYAHEGWIDAATKIASILDGSVLQYRAKREVVIAGVPFLLYGRLDALRAGTIFDIKFTGKYDVGKYVTYTQHPMYFAIVPEAIDFTYLVSNGSSVWKETYRRDESPAIEPIIADFVEWLKFNGLWELYCEHWLALKAGSHA